MLSTWTNRKFHAEEQRDGKMKFEESWFDIKSDDTPEGIAPDISKEDFVTKV